MKTEYCKKSVTDIQQIFYSIKKLNMATFTHWHYHI